MIKIHNDHYFYYIRLKIIDNSYWDVNNQFVGLSKITLTVPSSCGKSIIGLDINMFSN